MVREICKDEAFPALKAEPATTNDLGVAQDLLDGQAQVSFRGALKGEKGRRAACSPAFSFYSSMLCACS